MSIRVWVDRKIKLPGCTTYLLKMTLTRKTLSNGNPFIGVKRTVLVVSFTNYERLFC